jgi:hypothetical protein
VNCELVCDARDSPAADGLDDEADAGTPLVLATTGFAVDACTVTGFDKTTTHRFINPATDLNYY